MSFFFDEQLRPQLVAAIAEQNKQLAKIAAAQESIAATLGKIYHRAFRVSNPGVPALVVISENGQMLVFKLTPPWDSADADVVSCDVTYKIGDADAVTVNVLRGAEIADLEGADGATVHIEASYVDDATPEPNRSPVKMADFVLSDTIAPAAPGDFGLTVTGEK